MRSFIVTVLIYIAILLCVCEYTNAAFPCSKNWQINALWLFRSTLMCGSKPMVREWSSFVRATFLDKDALSLICTDSIIYGIYGLGFRRGAHGPTDSFEIMSHDIDLSFDNSKTPKSFELIFTIDYDVPRSRHVLFQQGGIHVSYVKQITGCEKDNRNYLRTRFDIRYFMIEIGWGNVMTFTVSEIEYLRDIRPDFFEDGDKIWHLIATKRGVDNPIPYFCLKELKSQWQFCADYVVDDIKVPSYAYDWKVYPGVNDRFVTLYYSAIYGNELSNADISSLYNTPRLSNLYYNDIDFARISNDARFVFELDHHDDYDDDEYTDD